MRANTRPTEQNYRSSTCRTLNPQNVSQVGPGRPGDVKHAPSFDVPGVVWHPFGRAGGVTTTSSTLVPARPELIILVVCPSGEDAHLIPQGVNAAQLSVVL